jgi:hypothetical protein
MISKRLVTEAEGPGQEACKHAHASLLEACEGGVALQCLPKRPGSLGVDLAPFQAVERDRHDRG